jgi:hypothetical protein
MGDCNICHAGLRFTDGRWLIWPVFLRSPNSQLPKKIVVRSRTFVLSDFNSSRPLYYEQEKVKQPVLKVTKDDELRYLRKQNKILEKKVSELSENISMLRKTIDYLKRKLQGSKSGTRQEI